MEFGRVFNAARREQGFRNQEHLDAFYRYMDHVESCAECQKPGHSVWLEGDASWQPTVNRCPEGLRLERMSL